MTVRGIRKERTMLQDLFKNLTPCFHSHSQVSSDERITLLYQPNFPQSKPPSNHRSFDPVKRPGFLSQTRLERQSILRPGQATCSPIWPPTHGRYIEQVIPKHDQSMQHKNESGEKKSNGSNSVGISSISGPNLPRTAQRQYLPRRRLPR